METEPQRLTGTELFDALAEIGAAPHTILAQHLTPPPYTEEEMANKVAEQQSRSGLTMLLGFGAIAAAGFVFPGASWTSYLLGAGILGYFTLNTALGDLGQTLEMQDQLKAYTKAYKAHEARVEGGIASLESHLEAVGVALGDDAGMIAYLRGKPEILEMEPIRAAVGDWLYTRLEGDAAAGDRMAAEILTSESFAGDRADWLKTAKLRGPGAAGPPPEPPQSGRRRPIVRHFPEIS